MPTGATTMDTMVWADTLPASPGSSARAGTSAVSAPAGSTASRVVSKRTSPAVMHTVPLGMDRSSWAASPAVNRTVPWAGRASLRSRLRSWA